MDIFEGGIPTTFEHSGEQWDYPNAWPPLQYIVVMALANTGVPEAMRFANEIATKWVRSNFEVWKQKTAMLEKVRIIRIKPPKAPTASLDERAQIALALYFVWAISSRATQTVQLRPRSSPDIKGTPTVLASQKGIVLEP